MIAEFYFKNYAQASNVRIVNRQHSQHPNFKDEYNVAYFEKQLAEGKFSMVDIFGWASEIEKIWYRPCSPPWGGWAAKSNNITVKFKVNLSFSCKPSVAKRIYEKVLEGKEENPDEEDE